MMTKPHAAPREESEAQVLTVADAARLMGIGASSCWRLVYGGQLPHVRPLPGRVGVLRSDVQAYLLSVRHSGIESAAAAAVKGV